MRRATAECGQAAIELVGLAGLVIVAVLAAAQVLAAGAAAELADHAAEAGAIALLQGADPKLAAGDAVPGWSRRRIEVRIDGRRVLVRLRPPSLLGVPAGVLAATGEADAGPRLRLR